MKNRAGGNCAQPENAAKTAESLDPCGFPADGPGFGGDEVGHSGHNGNPPVFDSLCPRNPLNENGKNALGTLGTVGTVIFQGGKEKRTRGTGKGGAEAGNGDNDF
jgi:hypothetical protein